MEHVLSLSYGKDSIACIEAVKELGLPLDRIIHAEIWATKTIPADLPPMIEFKKKADKVIKSRYGVEVEHITAKYTYEEVFYRTIKSKKSKHEGQIYGFPIIKAMWCKSKLKISTLKMIGNDDIQYIGIAADEPKRLEKLDGVKKIAPLFLVGWNEQKCFEWCKKNDLLSPIYKNTARGGCWFCPCQGVDQLRLLRKNYPELWRLLLKWDNVSPKTFKPNHTVKDYDQRFQLEDEGMLLPGDKKFRWSCLKNGVQLSMFTNQVL